MKRQKYRYLDPLTNVPTPRPLPVETFPTPAQKASQAMFDQILHDIRETERTQAAIDAAQAIRTAHNQAVERYARYLEREHERLILLFNSDTQQQLYFTLAEAAAMLRQLGDSPPEEEL